MRRLCALAGGVLVAIASLVAVGGQAGATAATTYTSAALGTVGTTPAFVMSSAWTMRWSYSCAGAATQFFLVSVNQPASDPADDEGPNEAGASGSGTDYYLDTGTFSLTVVSGCAWSITVATGSAAAAVPVTLSSTSTGQSGSTQAFEVSGVWTLVWRYQCPGAGATGVFVVTVVPIGTRAATLQNVVETGTGGTGVATYDASGTFHLVVSSTCDWTVTIAGTSAFIRIDGATTTATAAAELEHQFTAARGDCPGSGTTRPVVLATNRTYPDALASAYLERTLDTGILLTSPTALSPVTAAAIEQEGITTVDVVGGAVAVSTALIATLESMPADACGGRATPDGGHIAVTRISGATQYTTAAQIARTPTATQLGTLELAGAYTGETAGGGGRYNETAGNASSAPAGTGALPTAIVATGKGFQDAEAASTLAYAERVPILLTTPSSLSAPTASALEALAVAQVVVMGGPLAVSDAVVAELEALGVSVLRVAGTNAEATAVELAALEIARSPTGLGWSGTGSLVVARGDFYSDGLAGAAVAADGPGVSAPMPLLLTESPAVVGTALSGFLATAGKTGIGGVKVTKLVVLGGTGALAPTTVGALVADL